MISGVDFGKGGPLTGTVQLGWGKIDARIRPSPVSELMGQVELAYRLVLAPVGRVRRAAARLLGPRRQHLLPAHDLRRALRAFPQPADRRRSGRLARPADLSGIGPAGSTRGSPAALRRRDPPPAVRDRPRAPRRVQVPCRPLPPGLHERRISTPRRTRSASTSSWGTERGRRARALRYTGPVPGVRGNRHAPEAAKGPSARGGFG